MPTVLRTGPYRFYFYSHEPNERPHVHVERAGTSCTYWLVPVAFAVNLGFGLVELRRVEALVVRHQAVLVEAWYEFFGS